LTASDSCRGVGGRSPDWITDAQIEDGLDQFQRNRLPVLAQLGVIEPKKPLANGG